MKEIIVGGARSQKKVAVQPAITTPRKESFVAKVLSVISDDIRSVVLHNKAVVADTEPGWEEYKRFLELAKGKK